MRREIKLLLIADGALILAIEMFAPLYAVFVQGIGGDLLTAGWAYATFNFTGAVVILGLSRLARDVRGKEFLVPLGYALSSLGIFGYLLVQEPLHLFLVQIVLGVAFAVLTPAWDVLFSNFLDESRPLFEWGVEESLSYFMPAFGAGGGALIATLFGFPALFVVMFLISLVGTFVSLGLVRWDRDGLPVRWRKRRLRTRRRI